MMYVIQFPFQRDPYIWIAEDESHFIRIAEEQCWDQKGKELLCVHTGKELQAIYGQKDCEGDMLIDLEKKIGKFGPDQTFYKKFNDDFYNVEPIDKYKASINWFLKKDDIRLTIYKSKEEALEALFDDDLWMSSQLKYARKLLKKKLEEVGTVISLHLKSVLKLVTEEEASKAIFKDSGRPLYFVGENCSENGVILIRRDCK